MKKVLSLFTVTLLSLFACSQLKSPEDFLGYKVGTRFTPHWQLVNYFRHAAEQSTDMIKLQEYGKTNEGRPLILAYISTAENIANLENIRKNNLRLANLALDRMGPTTET